LPSELQVRIRRHFRFLWHRSLTMDDAEDKILHQLSTKLCQEVFEFIYRETVRTLPVFTLLNDATYHTALLRGIQPLFSSAGECIMVQGHVGEELYLIMRGSMEVLFNPLLAEIGQGSELPNSPNAKSGRSTNFDSSSLATSTVLEGSVRVAEVGFGDIVGEIAMFQDKSFSVATPDHRRTATVRALEHCEMFAIKKDQAMDICNNFSVFHDALTELGEMRLQRTSKVRQASESIAERTRTKERSSRVPAQVWKGANMKLRFSRTQDRRDPPSYDEATRDAAPSTTTLKEMRPALAIGSGGPSDVRMESSLTLVMQRMKVLKAHRNSEHGESAKPSEAVQLAISNALQPIEQKLDRVLAASGAATEPNTEVLGVATSRALEPTQSELQELQELQSQVAHLTKRLDELTTMQT